MTALRRTRGAAEFAMLAEALRIISPACADDARYVAEPEDLTADDTAEMVATCGGCDLRAECSAYGRRGHPTGGMWAGRTYLPRKRAPRQTPQQAQDAQ